MTKEQTMEERLAKFMKKYELGTGDWNIIDGYIPLEKFIRQEKAISYNQGCEDTKINK